MENERRLVKIGGAFVKQAIGFYVEYGYWLKVAEGGDDDCQKKCGCEIHPMEDIEMAFRNSPWNRCISWCDGRPIVNQGQRNVTFRYDDMVSTVVFK